MLLKENAKRIEKRYYKNNKSQLIYIFECSQCKKELNVQISSFKTHSGKCTRCTQLKTPYKYIYNELKSHRKNNISFDLSFEEFLSIIKNNKCEYCETKVIYNEYSKVWNKSNSRAHHLDRKDNNDGYTKNNVVVCCWECNRLKSNRFTYEEFKQLSPILKKIMNDRKNYSGK